MTSHLATLQDFARRHRVPLQDLLDDFGERAGILEYDADLSREEAERVALVEVLALERWKR